MPLSGDFHLNYQFNLYVVLSGDHKSAGGSWKGAVEKAESAQFGGFIEVLAGLHDVDSLADYQRQHQSGRNNYFSLIRSNGSKTNSHFHQNKNSRQQESSALLFRSCPTNYLQAKQKQGRGREALAQSAQSTGYHLRESGRKQKASSYSQKGHQQ